MQPFESPFCQRVVDPPTPAGALDQASLTQNLQVIAQEIAWDRGLGLQVADAARPTDEHVEQLQADRIRHRGQEAGCRHLYIRRF